MARVPLDATLPESDPNVDINCSKMWVQGHEEVLGVSWTGSNPTSRAGLMTECLPGRKRKGWGKSLLLLAPALLSIPLRKPQALCGLHSHHLSTILQPSPGAGKICQQLSIAARTQTGKWRKKKEKNRLSLGLIYKSTPLEQLFVVKNPLTTEPDSNHNQQEMDSKHQRLGHVGIDPSCGDYWQLGRISHLICHQ